MENGQKVALLNVRIREGRPDATNLCVRIELNEAGLESSLVPAMREAAKKANLSFDLNVCDLENIEAQIRNQLCFYSFLEKVPA